MVVLVDVDCDVLRRLYEDENVDVASIASMHGVSITTLYLLLRRCGVRFRLGERCRLTDSIEEEIVRLYREGAPIRKIVEKFGISVNRLYAILARHRVPLRRKKSPSAYRRVTKEEIDIVLRLWRDGLTPYRIAKQVGRPVSTVYYIIKRYQKALS